MKYKLLNQLSVCNKRVFLRTDFNVPIVNKKILDDSKIKAHHATIDYLTNKGARIILGTHVGRPDLQKNCSRKELIHNNSDTDAEIIFKHLKKIYGDKISFIDAGSGMLQYIANEATCPAFVLYQRKKYSHNFSSLDTLGILVT